MPCLLPAPMEKVEPATTRTARVRSRPTSFFSLDSGHNSRLYPLPVAAAIHIGKAAKLAGVSVDTIRFYQKLGLIDRGSRSAGGYRLFGGEQIHNLKFVRHAQELGFSLTSATGQLLREIDNKTFEFS